MPREKTFSQFVMDAIGELVREAREAGLINKFRVLDRDVFGREVAKLAAFGTEDHAAAYREFAEFLRRYGAMAEEDRFYIAAVVAEAAAALIEKTLAEKAEVNEEVE